MASHPVHPAEPDPYHLLGLTPDATAEQINAAYRRAVRRMHPDTAADHPAADGPHQIRASLQQLQTARARLLSTPPNHPHPPTTTAPHIETDHPATVPRPAWTHRERRSPDLPHRRDLIAGPVRYHGPPRHT